MIRRPQHSRASNGEKSGGFAGNVARLSAGEGVAQIISVFSLPILSRLYPSGEFGIFSAFGSALMILFPISTFRFNNAMMLPEKDSEATNLLALSILGVVGFSLLTAGGIAGYLFLPGVQDRWQFTLSPVYLWVLPLCMFIAAASQVMVFWSLRKKMFTSMAVSRVLESVFDRGLTLTAGALLGGSALWLVTGRILGPGVAVGYLARKAALFSVRLFWREISFVEMKRLAWRYRDFALFSNFAYLISNLARELPLLLLASLYSLGVAGYYGLALRVVNMPIQLVGDSISRAFFQLAASQGNKAGGLARDTVKLLRSMLTLSLPLIALLVLLGRPLFSVLFGSEWSEAGSYCEILGILTLVVFFFRPLSVLYDVYEKQRQRLLFNVIVLAAQSAILLLGSKWAGSVHVTLMVFAAVSVVIHAAGCGYLLRLAGVDLLEVCRIIPAKLAGILPLVIGLAVVRSLLPWHPVGSLLVLAASLLVQGWFTVCHDTEAREAMRQILPVLWRSRGTEPHIL